MEPGGSFVQHWHEESVNPRDTVEIEIDNVAILEMERDEEGLSLTLKPESLLAKVLSDRRVKNVLREVIADIEAGLLLP